MARPFQYRSSVQPRSAPIMLLMTAAIPTLSFFVKYRSTNMLFRIPFNISYYQFCNFGERNVGKGERFKANDGHKKAECDSSCESVHKSHCPPVLYPLFASHPYSSDPSTSAFRRIHGGTRSTLASVPRPWTRAIILALFWRQKKHSSESTILRYVFRCMRLFDA